MKDYGKSLQWRRFLWFDGISVSVPFVSLEIICFPVGSNWIRSARFFGKPLLILLFYRKSIKRSVTKSSAGSFGGDYCAPVCFSFRSFSFVGLLFSPTEISRWWIQCHCCHVNWWRRPGYHGSWSCNMFWC